MSYTSKNILPKMIQLAQVQEILVLLGYKKYERDPDLKDHVARYHWFDEDDYRSYVGVELDIYRTSADRITIATRTAMSRSYWDLTQQNKTIKLLRALFGGSFTTDSGRNRCMRPSGRPPSPLSSGCFLSRWRFNNDLIRARAYLSGREFKGRPPKDGPTGIEFFDQINPRLLSNNLLLPYVVAIWEEYFRSTFVAALKYTDDRDAVLKRTRLSHGHLEQLALGFQPVARVVAEGFNFQRPTAIAENFRLLNRKLDLAAAMRKPYRRRKTSLFDSIEKLIEDRNEFVHSGRMNLKFFDIQLQSALSDMEVAVDRSYKCVASHYNFFPHHDYWA